MVAGTTGIAGNPCVGQPVWQHPALLVCVQCEALPWSLSSTAARGGTGTGRVPPGLLLGASGVLLGVNSHRLELAEPSIWQYCAYQNRIRVCLLPVNSMGW